MSWNIHLPSKSDKFEQESFYKGGSYVTVNCEASLLLLGFAFDTSFTLFFYYGISGDNTVENPYSDGVFYVGVVLNRTY